MPLTARHPRHGILDASAPQLGADVPWERIYGVRPRAALQCPACTTAMRAKRSSRGQCLFAHTPTDRPCWLAGGESVQHRQWKTDLATAIRAAGWSCALEHLGNGWRADVLAMDPATGARIAWEVQLSPITPTTSPNGPGGWPTTASRCVLGDAPSGYSRC